MLLSQAVESGRDNNNFNLIRVVAALSVLFSHSFALTLGGLAEPLVQLTGGATSPGALALDTFFVTSGFLVTASIIERKDVAYFAWARFVRIWPALVTAVIVIVLVIGPLMTKDTLASYFSNHQVYRYLWRTSLMIFGVEQKLPGVFATNTESAVDGSLWTLPYEVRMYGILALTWMAAHLIGRGRPSFLKVLVAAFALGSFIWLIIAGGNMRAYSPFLHLFFMFFAGASFYVFRSFIKLTGPFALFLLIAACGSLLFGTTAFAICHMIALPYVVLYGAYAPTPGLHAYNKLGDYSYGIYIFAYPIQQSVIQLIQGIEPIGVFLIASPITTALAICSWTFIEKPALRLKNNPPAILRATLLRFGETTKAAAVK
jgi:peptidoglycan/LPS O-acetylase OafA/YrhL